MKKCGMCKEWKDESEFAKRTFKKSVGTQGNCKKCSNANRAIYYKNNREQQVRVRKEYRQNNRIWFDEYKSTLKCKECPENNPACLDFHHRDPSKKEVTLGDAVRMGWSKERTLKEIEKCDVLCANCHRKLHYNEKNGLDKIMIL